MAMAVDAPSPPRTRRFTADEVWRMIDAGILREDERLELIDGELCLVSPTGPDHTFVVGELTRRLSLAYGEHYMAIVQSTIAADAYNLPEPDVTVVPARGSWVYDRRNPSTDESILLIEVAVTIGALDRRKSAVYRDTGTPVYWIVDVPRRCVVVHEGPRPDGTWERVRELGEDDVLELPGLGSGFAVREILRPAPFP